MATHALPLVGANKRRINVASKAFNARKYEYFAWLREHAPVYRGKILIL